MDSEFWLGEIKESGSEVVVVVVVVGILVKICLRAPELYALKLLNW